MEKHLNLSGTVRDCQTTESRSYPYYCPLCMLFYHQILRTECCSNYVCKYCFSDMRTYRRAEQCPFCTNSPFYVIEVASIEDVKSYKDDREKKDEKKKQNTGLPIKKEPEVSCFDTCIIL